jgi:hypothetical protein
MRLFAFLTWISLTACGVVAQTNPATELAEAIRKLSEKPNYSWTALPKSETPSFRPGLTEGKTERNGHTYFKLVVGQNSVEAAFREDKSAIKTEDKWESAQELEGERAWVARRLNSFRVPATEAQELLSKADAITKKNGVFSANLKPDGVRDILLTRRVAATQTARPVNPKGSVKFWTKDGALSKYEYTIQGKFVSDPPSQSLDINLTTTVEIKDVGTTRVQVPEEAKKKLL